MSTDGRRPQGRHRRLHGRPWWRAGALALVTLAALLPMPFQPPAEAAETAGLGVFVTERGKLTSSYDAEGTEGSAGELTIHKPAGATVRRAVLLAATTGFTSATMSGPVTVSVDGAEQHEVLLGHGTPSGISSYNYWADATAALQKDLDAAPAGNVGLHVVEPAPESSVDGVILAVIFNDPAKTVDSSVTLLFGALQTGGDQFNLQLERPFRANDPAAQMQMSLGISYSCQTAGPCGSSGQQYSEIEVDGKRVTSAAGGEDDGVTANGGLITVGGTGDTVGNPSDPNATPTDPRSDDELYDLRPFLTDGQTSIKVDTRNPSGDDNIFFAAFDGNPPIGDITTGGAQFVYVALGDSYSSGEGAGFDVRPSATYLADGYENGSNFPPQVGPQENTYRDGNTCHRGLLNYAKINRDRFKPNAQIVLIDRTCSGATIENPSSGTKPPIVGDGGTVDPRSQVRQAIDRLNGIKLTASDVDLVTVGMGGNDAGFGTIVATCLLPAMSRIILQKYPRSPGEVKLISNLLSCEAVDTYGTKTDTLIKALQAKEVAAQRAILATFPSAQVMQLDYPNILPTKNAPEYCGGIAKDDIEFARKKIKKIDESVRKAVKETNDPRLSVAEIEPAFGPNALCPAVAGTALANGIQKDAVDREVTRLLADAPTRQRLDTLVDRYNDYKKCLANQANPFDNSSCNVSAAFNRLKAAATSLMDQMKNQENTIFANLVSTPGTTDDTPDVAYDRSRGLFHPNAKGFTVMACQVLASYEARTGDDCPSSPVPPVSTANGQFVGSPPLRVNARSTVELLLAGFQAATPVVLTMFSEPQPLGTATADSAGTVRTRITLPDLPGGVHRLQIDGRSPDGTAFTKEVRLDLPGRPNGSYAAYLAGFDKEPTTIDPATEAELVDVTLNGQPVGAYEPDEEGGVLVEVPLSGRITGPADFTLRAVSRRTGKAVTTVVANPVPVASSLWATSQRDDAIRVVGAGVVADGRVHSEGGIVIRNSAGALTGGVEYATRLSTAGGNVKITPAARQVTAGQGTPSQAGIAQYRPGGKAATAAAKYTAIRKSDCRNGVWVPARGVKLTGVVYVPCAVLVSGPKEIIDATIAAEGKIVVAAANVTIGPEVGGPSLVSGASGARAIDLIGSRVQTRGVVHASNGEVVIAGTAGRFICGVQADTITMAGTGLTAPMAARCLTAS